MKKIKAYGSKKTWKIDGRFFSVKKMFVCFFKSLNHPRSQTLSSLHFLGKIEEERRVWELAGRSRNTFKTSYVVYNLLSLKPIKFPANPCLIFKVHHGKMSYPQLDH